MLSQSKFGLSHFGGKNTRRLCTHLINTEYVIFNPMTSYSFQFGVLNCFQFPLLCQAYISVIIKRNWKEFKTQIEKNSMSLGENYFGSIIYFPKLFLDSIIFQVMLVILLNIITGWSFLPRIEIMITMLIHVLNLGKVLGGTTIVPTPT